ncbi:hypothetical protein H9Q70_011977 [Fusarium xylarioides]|nr:hypothetical protein H9Q70_011977 [Fusarium xylarioides]KAG5778139.1 hypothetical protein H9Q73_008191 [Fusarium xylarioides]
MQQAGPSNVPPYHPHPPHNNAPNIPPAAELPSLNVRRDYLPRDFTGVSLSTRIDHTTWRCHDMTCLAINKMRHAYCRQCQRHREPGAHALGDQFMFIGFLGLVNPRGNEYWHYPSPLELYRMYLTVVPVGYPDIGSPPVTWSPGGIDGINPGNSPPALEWPGDPGVGAQDNTPAGDAIGTNREAKKVRFSDAIEVCHMDREVGDVQNEVVNDEDLEEPEEESQESEESEEEAQSEERALSKKQGKQPVKQAQSKKRKKQPEDERDANGGAAGSGSGKKKRRRRGRK